MVNAIEENGVRVMVDFHNRWSPPFNAAYTAVRAGELGELYSGYFRLNDIKWVATDLLPWAAQSSILWFLGSHSLDTLRWIFGSEVERVYCVSRSGVLKGLGVDTVDEYLTTLEFKNVLSPTWKMDGLPPMQTRVSTTSSAICWARRG